MTNYTLQKGLVLAGTLHCGTPCLIIILDVQREHVRWKIAQRITKHLRDVRLLFGPTQQVPAHMAEELLQDYQGQAVTDTTIEAIYSATWAQPHRSTYAFSRD